MTSERKAPINTRQPIPAPVTQPGIGCAVLLSNPACGAGLALRPARGASGFRPTRYRPGAVGCLSGRSAGVGEHCHHSATLRLVQGWFVGQAKAKIENRKWKIGKAFPADFPTFYFPVSSFAFRILRRSEDLHLQGALTGTVELGEDDRLEGAQQEPAVADGEDQVVA